MLECNDLIDVHLEKVHQLDDLVQNSSCSIQSIQIKSTLSIDNKNENLQNVKQANPDKNCIFSVWISTLKSSSKDFSYKQFKGNLAQSKNHEQFEDNPVQKKIIPTELLAIGRDYSSKWRSQWEIKCKEWQYQDKFNIEVLNFAKKIYFPGNI